MRIIPQAFLFQPCCFTVFSARKCGSFSRCFSPCFLRLSLNHHFNIFQWGVRHLTLCLKT
ncbi:hypothetical protein HMPREF9065_00661 [Aggregatibacter sp. oral taxon 458 str. W10330]|nr:hypothetical protein HMPREF9065_00661 [Aggregatibacter sp. oral taxon 458 str. W10330]